MAIALEADFRSIKTSQAVEPPERQPGKPGGGEAFANSLARARDTDAPEQPEVLADTSATAAVLPFPPPVSEPAITPEAEAAIAAEIPALGAEATAEIQKSEIAVDRQIVREGIEAQAAGTDTDSARAQAALANAHTITEASEASEIATNANVAATLEAGKAAMQTAALSTDSSRAPATESAASQDEGVAASNTIAAVPGTLPATAAANAKDPTNRQIQKAEAVADSDAFALMAPKGEAAAPVDLRLSVTRIAPLTDITGKDNPLDTARVPADPDASPIIAPKGEAAASLDLRFSDTGIAPLTDITGKGNLLDTASLNSATATGTQILAAVAAPAASQVPAAVPGLVINAPALAIVTASPAQIVDIVAQSADDGQSDRVVVQLDPPELGRVSIDFKFDAQGLQHVTITSETPEAMRQLRQMHSELVQSLERHGIGSENLSFQHQQQGSPQSPPPNPFARAAALGDTITASTAINSSTDSTPNARTLPGGRLDIRL